MTKCNLTYIAIQYIYYKYYSILVHYIRKIYFVLKYETGLNVPLHVSVNVHEMFKDYSSEVCKSAMQSAAVQGTLNFE